MFSHYQSLAGLRKQNAALTAGDFRVLLADDAADTVPTAARPPRRARLWR